MPKVWYVAAGYSRSAGIEVYILNYASEMRRRGFVTEVVVFEPLPETSHRCLDALRERGIPIRSLGDAVSGRARRRAGVAGVVDRVRGRHTTEAERLRWENKKAQVSELETWIRREQPDIIHVQGRLIAEAWPVLPPERTIFHIATAGARDESWDASEVEAFRSFVGRCARVLAPGSGVVERFRKDFGVTRDVDVVFTMAPDETEGHWSLGGGRRAEERGQRLEGGGWKVEGGSTVDGGQTTEDGGRNAECGTRNAKCGTAGMDDGGRKERCEPVDPNQEPGTKHQAPSTKNQGPRTLRFGYLGRFHEEKGIRELLEALRLLRERGMDVPFLFAGEGPMEGEIRRSASCLVRGALCGEEEKSASCLVRGTSELPSKRSNTPFTNAGLVPRNQGCNEGEAGSRIPHPESPVIRIESVGDRTLDDGEIAQKDAKDAKENPNLESRIPSLAPPLIRVERVEHPVKSLMQMDVVVLPSRGEAMPLALVEGLMCGRPCIARDVGGIPDLIRTGIEGLLISEPTAIELSKAIGVFVRMPDLEFKECSRAARARYESCCRPEQVGATVERLYDALIHAGRL